MKPRLRLVSPAVLLLALAASSPAQSPDDRPTDAAQATSSWTLPPGFQVSLFAAEPQVTQPIAIALDGRDRLWVCENETYSDVSVNFDLTRHDRIVILEDTDHDGRADSRKVFWDQAQRLTSVEIGFGGVWALCAPHLLFIPDANHDDVPDGPPVVVLDGWDDSAVRHNIVNGLKWGPDGWLYGRHGILATSKVGPPGTPDDQRVPINTGVWRYHPTRKVFEAVCHGTTNPWGMDWNEHGEPFFINTVIGHLWHALPGAHLQRMYGEDLRPDLFQLLPQNADHFHWDTAEKWSDIRQIGVTSTTDQAGGGHAHSGLMCYLGDNWPDRYRDTLFTVNLHGHRLNNDTLERQGAGYVAKHAPDFAKTSDPWFRAVDLTYGADGGVYVADWSDIGECHENDGVHRASGRIFKITHGQPPRPAVADVDALPDSDLVSLQTHRNEWFARQARRVLQERAAAGHPMAESHASLRSLLENDTDIPHRLRALWCLHATGGLAEPALLGLLDDQDEHIRTWAIRFLGDGGTLSPEARDRFVKLASADSSGLVLVYLASSLQRLAPADRWPLASALSARTDFASDPTFPLMVWYGVESAIDDRGADSASLAAHSRVPLVSQLIARRLALGFDARPGRLDPLLASLANTTDAPARLAILTGIAEALQGRRQVPAPGGWQAARDAIDRAGDPAAVALARSISATFGDPDAITQLVSLARDGAQPAEERRAALRVLADARAEAAIPALLDLLADPALSADAVRSLSSFQREETPSLLLDRFSTLPDAGRDEAIIGLCAGPRSAALLLDAIEAGKVPRDRVPVFQIRQMMTFGDGEKPDPDAAAVRGRVSSVWPELRPVSETARDRMAVLKTRLTPGELARADLAAGRALFNQTCSACHVLFGQGARIGPELTGSQRSNLDYLLENLADPSATVGADFRMSVVALADGRVLSGVAGNRNAQTLTLQTPTEKLILPVDEIDEIRQTNLSLMPEGQLDLLRPDQVRDLIGYLMSPSQVPLPQGD